MRRILAIPLVFSLLGFSAARAGEGFCRGDQERARIVFEALGFGLDSLFEEGFQAIRRAARNGFRWASRAAVWQLHMESWRALAFGLLNPGLDPDSLMEYLRPGWTSAARILSGVDRRPPDPEGSLRKAVIDSVASFSVCRAVTLGHAEPCGRLFRASPDRFQECRELFVNFGILFSHRCEPESVNLASWLTGMQFQDAFDWCDILARDAQEKCRLGADQSAHELAGCRAMASLDESFCRAEGLSAEQTGDCLGKLKTYRYVRGLLPEEQWQPWLVDPVFESAARSARHGLVRPEDCLECARRAYLRTAAAFFWLPEPKP